MTDSPIKSKITVTSYEDGHNEIEAPDGINIADLPTIAGVIILASLTSPQWPDEVPKNQILDILVGGMLDVVDDNTDLDVGDTLRRILEVLEDGTE